MNKTTTKVTVTMSRADFKEMLCSITCNANRWEAESYSSGSIALGVDEDMRTYAEKLYALAETIKQNAHYTIEED